MPQLNSWRGLAFERVCFSHITMIKKALGVEGVSSTESPWIAKLQESLSFKQTIHLTLVTTLGLKHNAHSGIFQKVVTMSELFD